MAEVIPDEIMREAHLLMNRFYLTDYGKDEIGLVARALLARDTAARRECAEIARYTYAKDALHFELGTAIAAAIEATIGGRDEQR